MPDLTEESVRHIVREETTPQFAELRSDIRDVESTLNEKMDAMLTKMDGFTKGLEDEKHERLFGDVQLERRVEQLESH